MSLFLLFSFFVFFHEKKEQLIKQNETESTEGVQLEMKPLTFFPSAKSQNISKPNRVLGVGENRMGTKTMVLPRKTHGFSFWGILTSTSTTS